MATKTRHAVRTALLLVFVAFVVSCSSDDPEASQAVETPTAPVDEINETDQDDDVASSATEDVLEPTAVVASTPTLADDGVASVDRLAIGEQVQDNQGNLLAVYGVVAWPTAFDEMPPASRSTFPFFGDISTLSNADTDLVALDIGMCSAGIDAVGFGTAEFFVHDDPDSALSTDPVLDRAVLARHPVVQPGFSFPTTAECLRGWLPVIWSGSAAPQTARYVLATRESATSDIERYVYQWDLDGFDDLAETADESELFGVGQTVTFNEGRLTDSTVVVNGWAEFVGSDSPVEGTRLVGVSLNACPAQGQFPEFGLGIDGWNLASPLSTIDATDGCFDGWIEFAVPFGGVPTSFFASDARDSVVGYAEWSLAGAALASPNGT